MSRSFLRVHREPREAVSIGPLNKKSAINKEHRKRALKKDKMTFTQFVDNVTTVFDLRFHHLSNSFQIFSYISCDF